LIFHAGQIQKVQSAQIRPEDMQATSENIERVLEWLRVAHAELSSEMRPPTGGCSGWLRAGWLICGRRHADGR